MGNCQIFQLNDNKSETTQDIDLKFSAFVHHMSGVNWRRNFSHCLISGSVAPSSMQKLWTPPAAIFVEKKIWKKFWCGFRPIWVTPWKEFLISWKKWRFEIFGTSKASRASGPWVTVCSHLTTSVDLCEGLFKTPFWYGCFQNMIHSWLLVMFTRIYLFDNIFLKTGFL